MSALDELLKKEYWERDYDDKGEYWWYCGGDDPKIAREELEAMKARIAELEAELKKAYLVEWHKGYEEGLKNGYSNGVGDCQG